MSQIGNFGAMAKNYHPQERVGKGDVVYCTALHSVEKDRVRWMDEHLMKWQDFSREDIEFHDVEPAPLFDTLE